MKKAALLALAFVPIVLLSLNWSRGGSAQPPAARAGQALSFRLVFGEKQERPADYSGSVAVSQGKIVRLVPWRFFGGDALDGASGWKLHIKTANFENQPDLPRQLSTPGQTLNLVPAGVTVTVDAPPQARVSVKTAEAQFDFALGDLRGARVLWFAGGDAWVQQVPSTGQISEPAAGPGSEENDYPSVAVTRSGVVWTAWQAYKDNGDHVYARHSTAGGWSQPFRLTDEKGDVFQTTVREDREGRIWVVWSERKEQEWDLYARTYDGRSWSARRKITSADHPNIYHKLVSDGSGALHLVWVAFRDGGSWVMWSKLEGGNWTAPKAVSEASAWAPDAAADSKGNLWVAWDSYRTGNYDIYARRIDASGSLGEIRQVTSSARFHAHASVAVDKQDRLWIGWDEAGANWGKDYTRDDTWRGSTLYADRRPRIAVLEDGKWKQPPDVMSSIPRRYNRFIQLPKLATDGSGRIWVALQVRTSCGNNRADFWSANGHWERYLTTLEGDRWTPAMPAAESNSRNEGPFQMAPAASGVWMVWANDNRPMAGPPGLAGARRPGAKGKAAPPPLEPGRKLPIYEVDGAAFAWDSAPRPAVLADYQETPGNAASLHLNESADVKRIREYRTQIAGTNYRIVRGDFHRHTEISQDGAGDGSIDDYFRYMLDAAAMDTGVITDHNAGQDNEYTWWRTEKAHDLFLIPGRYTPLFGYERSVPFPNGHRNIVFAERGTRTLPITPDEQQGRMNTGPLLYPYLKQHRGICMLHSLATDQGSDYRDNDPEVEPLVEIYQGYHANYEYEGAPRAEAQGYVASAHGKYQPSGFYWNALAKGYLLGVQSSSDHISTHTSYTMIYTPGMGRQQLVDSMRKRHAYGATDNIVIDYTATDADNRVFLMGDSFAASAAPRLAVKVLGTDKISKIEIIKDGKFVFTSEPDSNTAQFSFVDRNPGSRTSYYYVRVMQVDRNLAWSSPIWVNYSGGAK